MYARKISALVVVSMFVLLAACNKSGGGSAAANNALKYVPAGSELVVSVDVKKLLASPTVTPQLDQVKKLLAAEKEYAEFTAAAGIDPFTNVSNLLAAGKTQGDSMVVVLSGSFDAKKAIEAIKAKNPPADAAFEAIDGSTILMGNKAAVDAAKASATKEPFADSPALKDVFATADKNRAIYGAAVVPAALAGAAPGSVGKAKAASFSLDLSDGLMASVMARFGSAEEATAAKTEAEAGLAQVKPMAVAMMQLPESLFSGISFAAAAADLNLNVKISAADLKTLSDKLNAMAGAMGGGMGAPGAVAPEAAPGAVAPVAPGAVAPEAAPGVVAPAAPGAVNP